MPLFAVEWHWDAFWFALLAAGAFGLQWLQYRFLVHAYPQAAFLGLIALIFLIAGVWIGARVFRRASHGAPFEANTRAQQTLGISERELQVLRLLADGRSNKEIASALQISDRTVKKHVSRILRKLDLQSRLQVGVFVALHPHFLSPRGLGRR